jgi:hypothetical protein
LPETQGEINEIRYSVASFAKATAAEEAHKPRKLSEHAPLLHKAVEPVCYVSVRLRRPNPERRVPAKSNQGHNDHDYDQQPLHDL